MVYLNYEKQEGEACQVDDSKFSKEWCPTFPDQLTYKGTSKGVTRERHSTSHKVIFVDNLPSYYSKNEFVELFRRFGEILDVKFMKHKTGAETGYGFIEFATEDSGRKAIAELHWTVIDSRNIRVSRAKPSVTKLSCTNLYIENIPMNWTNDRLQSHFSKICEVTSARVLMNRKNYESQGVGFVHCVSHDDARKALLWFNKKHREKDGLQLIVKFAKIPRTERKANKGQQVVDRAPDHDNKNQCAEGLPMSQPGSSKEGDAFHEVGIEVDTSQSKQNSSKHKSQDYMKSCGKVLEVSAKSTSKSPKNSKRIKRKKRRTKRTGKKGKHHLCKTETECYTHHLDTHAYQPQLLRSPIINDMQPNIQKFLDPCGREYFGDHRQNTPMPYSPHHQNLFQSREQKMPNLTLNSTRMRFDAKFEDFNNEYILPSMRSLPPTPKYHQIPFSPTGGYHHLYDSSPPPTCQWGPQMMLASKSNAASPFSWTYMNCHASITPDCNKALGCSRQLVSPQGVMWEQGCGCTNQLSKKMMQQREYTNMYTQNWNMHATKMQCSTSPAYDHASNLVTQKTDKHLSNGSDSKPYNRACVEGQMQGCHHNNGWSEFTPGQSYHGNLGTGIFKPTLLRSPQQGVNPQQYVWPGQPSNAHMMSPRGFPPLIPRDQSWSSASSCSGFTSLNGEQPHSSHQIPLQDMMGYPNGMSQNVGQQINSVYHPDSQNPIPSLLSQKQKNKVPANETGIKFDIKSREKEEQEPHVSDIRNVPRSGGKHVFRSTEKYMSMTSHHNRTKQGKNMSPASASTSPHPAFWGGSGSQYVTQVVNPQRGFVTPKHYQNWSIASSSSAQNEDQPPSKTEPTSLGKQHFFLGNFPVDVTITNGQEPSELTGFHDDKEVLIPSKRKNLLPAKFWKV